MSTFEFIHENARLRKLLRLQFTIDAQAEDILRMNTHARYSHSLTKVQHVMTLLLHIKSAQCTHLPTHAASSRAVTGFGK